MSIDSNRVHPRNALRRLGGPRIVAFYASVLALVGLMIAFLGETLAFVVTAWFVRDPGVHHLHDLAFVTLLWTVFVGVVVQLYDPETRVAAIQQALLATLVITGTNVLTGFFFPPVLVLGGLLLAAVVLHPAGRDARRVRTHGPISPVLAVLAILAGLPLSAYAADQLALQAAGDVHAQLGHYADMVTYSVLVVSLGLLASLKPIGWEVPLWSAAALAGVLGLGSVLYPALVSSAGPLWGVLAIVWGIAFVVAGEVSRRREV